MSEEKRSTDRAEKPFVSVIMPVRRYIPHHSVYVCVRFRKVDVLTRAFVSRAEAAPRRQALCWKGAWDARTR